MRWTADLRWLVAARAARGVGYGALSVVLGVYLSRLDLPAWVVGGLFSVALAGDTVLTVLVGRYGDRVGRRRTLLLIGSGMAATGLVFAATSEPLALLVTAFFGTLSATTNDSSPLQTIEQAAVPQIVTAEERTAAFSAVTTAGSIAGSAGTLLAALPGVLALAGIADELAVMRAMLASYAALALPTILSAMRLSPAVELGEQSSRSVGLGRSRRVVYWLAGLFALDSFGSGFVVQSLIVYWFTLRFGIGTEILGPVFFVTNLFSALSYQAAVPLARRIGLVNTMVFTHLPSNVFLMLVPVAPNAPLAIAALIARSLLSRMDVVPRQSYVAAIVAPEERTAAAAVTNLARSLSQTVAPVLSGWAIGVAALGAPFFLGGALKTVYDLALLAGFRARKAPEEAAKKGEL